MNLLLLGRLHARYGFRRYRLFRIKECSSIYYKQYRQKGLKPERNIVRFNSGSVDECCSLFETVCRLADWTVAQLPVAGLIFTLTIKSAFVIRLTAVSVYLASQNFGLQPKPAHNSQILADSH
jgi:hypothetical protein